MYRYLAIHLGSATPYSRVRNPIQITLVITLVIILVITLAIIGLATRNIIAYTNLTLTRVTTPLPNTLTLTRLPG